MYNPQKISEAVRRRRADEFFLILE